MSLALATASELVFLAEIESPETVVHRSATACCCERATACENICESDSLALYTEQRSFRRLPVGRVK